MTYFDEPKLIVDTGIARARLGEADAAEPLIADALRREPASNHRLRIRDPVRRLGVNHGFIGAR